MFDPDDIDAPDIFGDLGRDAMKVVGPLALLPFAPILLLIASAGGLPEAIETSAAPAAVADIPPDHLVVMRQVSNQTDIPWQILATISRVESGFGANMGPSSAGAVGYCQFMPSRWADYEVERRMVNPKEELPLQSLALAWLPQARRSRRPRTIMSNGGVSCPRYMMLCQIFGPTTGAMVDGRA